MDAKLMLMIPGPTPVPEQVLLDMAKHPVGHRSKEFMEVIGAVTQKLKWLHQTQHDVLILTVSGTGAVEAGIINFFSPGDRVLVGSNGKFGERWVEVCQAYGLQVDEVKAEWGKPLDPEEFRQKLEADTAKTYKGVIVTFSETSTGVLNDLKTINRHIKAHGSALAIVDAVTSLGAVNLPMDEWGIDVIASGSQKGYMIPPGLGFVAVSPKAWEAYKTAKLPKYYLDLGKYSKESAKNSTPFTSSVNMIVALHTALTMMEQEGLENIFQRHQRQMTATREAMKVLGLPLYTADNCGSPAITAVVPVSVDAQQIRSVMKKRFNIVLADGQDAMKGKMFRMGHLGYVSDRDILTAIAALEATLQELGHTVPNPGGAIAAAAKILAGK